MTEISLFNRFYRVMIPSGLILFVLTGYIGLTSSLQPNVEPEVGIGFPLLARLSGAFLVGPMSILLGWLVSLKLKDNLIGPLLIHWGCATNAELGVGYLPAFWGALGISYMTIVVLPGLALMLASFPSGRGVTPFWDRGMKGLTLLTMVTFLFLTLARPLGYGVTDPNPLALKFLIPYFGVGDRIGGVLIPIMIVLGMGLSIYRYRITHETERKQMRWLLVAAIFIALIFTFGSYLINLLGKSYFADFIFALISSMVFAAPSVGISLAILQHHLWDIDVIIRRTLQYSVVSGLLALIYFGLVIVFQGLFSTFSNQQSEFFIVISTLVIAALFNPLRLRVQDFIDRRFYRKKYNAEQALARFAAVARDEVDMDKLAAALIGVVEETVQPERVSLWLKDK